jgi:phosphonate transport system substrate-binding protein
MTGVVRNPGLPAILPRRGVLFGALGLLSSVPEVEAGQPVRFGLTPVFLDSDLELLSVLGRYLSSRLDIPVELVKRRTYQEITALLLSDQLEAAWICGFPYVRWRDRLSLAAVPLYHGRPLYQSYVIVRSDRQAQNFDDLRGDVHAFSDPDSNSGWLVTRHMLFERGSTPASFFSKTFFTYGHRNVVRAVSAGLAQSGSVDGYVWDVLAEREPELTQGTRVLTRSEWLGFPPIACTTARRDDAVVARLGAALMEMPSDPDGRSLLRMLQLDGFAPGDTSTFDGIDRLYRDIEAVL